MEQVRLLGWSMGGPYALASAVRLGDRVRRTAVVARCVPLDDPAALAELDAPDRILTWLAQGHRRSLRAVGRGWGTLARVSPVLWGRVVGHGEPEAEVQALAEVRGHLAEAARAAVAQPDGCADEYLAWSRSWGFEPADVATPVDVWQGRSTRWSRRSGATGWWPGWGARRSTGSRGPGTSCS